MNERKGIMYSSYITPDEYPCILHMVTEADFDTDHPNPYRIERIALEIKGYLKQKRKIGCMSGGDKT